MKEKLKEVVLEVLPDIDVENSDDFFDDGLDSMGVMTRVTLIEKAFQIEISAADVTADNFSNYADLLHLLERYKVE